MNPSTVEPTDEAARIAAEEEIHSPGSPDRALLVEAEAALAGARAEGRRPRGRSTPVLPLWARIAIFIATVAALIALFPRGAS